MNVHKLWFGVVLCFVATPLAPAKTFVVNQRHSAAADQNVGAEDEPFATITAAARVVKAGDEVLIHGGVYRERVALEASGTDQAPIVFRSAGSGRVSPHDLAIQRLQEWNQPLHARFTVVGAAWRPPIETLHAGGLRRRAEEVAGRAVERLRRGQRGAIISVGPCTLLRQ